MSFATLSSVVRVGFMTLLIGILGVVAWGFYLSWEVSRWDAKIEALCAANGGKDVATRVYETVMAPETPEYFGNSTPQQSLFIPERPDGRSLGARYPYVMETRVLEVLNSTNPSVVKYTERIVRVADNKVLGERFRYQRSGGGFSGPDPGEIRSCPKDTLERSLDVQVFLNHPSRVNLEKK